MIHNFFLHVHFCIIDEYKVRVKLGSKEYHILMVLVEHEGS